MLRLKAPEKFRLFSHLTQHYALVCFFSLNVNGFMEYSTTSAVEGVYRKLHHFVL